MLVNRNNYETFFLLYADNELCADEQLVVENFLLENEDLRGELNTILAAVLPTDEFSFTLKNSLYNNSFVDGSLQESLLLKIDNELSIGELNELNKSFAANASALKEEQLLFAIKLDATEIISCPQKGLLYKKERNNIVVFSILRWAAAAILIGVGLFFGWSLYNKKSIPDNVIANKQNSNPANIQKNNPATATKENIASNSKTINSKRDNKETEKTQNKIVAVSKKEQVTNSPVQKINEVNTKEIAVNKEIQKFISTSDNSIEKTMSKIQSSPLANVEKLTISALTNDNIVPLETSYIHASFMDNETSNNKILYMDEEDVKRSKVGGLFKKFKRIIERTAKIKTGTPLRIAGFQIGAD